MGLRSDGTICGNQREVYNMNRQSVLMEALPYIRKFHGKTIVIKLGGHAMVDPKIMNTVIEDAVLLHYVGMRVVLVHGGGPEITEKMKALGKEPKFIGSAGDGCGDSGDCPDGACRKDQQCNCESDCEERRSRCWSFRK